MGFKIDWSNGLVQMVISIIVSIILFVIGYRQSIGARKVRAKAASEDVIRTLVRRMVLENYNPVTGDILHLLEGKALQAQVSLSELLGIQNTLNRLFTEVMENDLVNPGQRQEILTKVVAALESVEQLGQRKPTVEGARRLSGLFDADRSPVLLLVLVTSAAGALVSFLPSILQSSSRIDIKTVALQMSVATIASMGVLAWYYVSRRLREGDREPIHMSSADDGYAYQVFRDQVAKILEDLRLKYQAGPMEEDNPYDWVVKLGDYRLGLDIRTWSQTPPLQRVIRLISEAQRHVETGIVNEAIFVPTTPFKVPRRVTVPNSVHFVPLPELRAYLKRRIEEAS